MKASCLCLTEGKALLVAMKYIKNKRCQRCLVKLHWLITLHSSLSFRASSCSPYTPERSLGNFSGSNLKFIYASKCFQAIPAKADTFAPMSACPESGGLQLLLPPAKYKMILREFLQWQSFKTVFSQPHSVSRCSLKQPAYGLREY